MGQNGYKTQMVHEIEHSVGFLHDKSMPDRGNYGNQVGLHDSQQPSAMTTREIEEASAADEELSAVRQCINRKPWDQLVSYKQYLKCSGELCTNVKLILRGTRTVIPKKLRPRVLSIAYEGP